MKATSTKPCPCPSRWLALLLASLALITAPLHAQSGVGLKADYYNGTSFTGSPALTRTDGTVDFTWGEGSPGAGVGVDTFVVRWSGQVEPEFSQLYTFYTNTDDGARLWVNGVQLVNDWTGHPPVENWGTINLVAGQKYDIVFEYYEGGGGAVSQLSWSSASRPKQIIPQNRLHLPAVVNGTGLTGNYFTNTNLSGSPTLTRTDATVNFDWSTASPGAGIGVDNFSVRWSGQVQPEFTELYHFYTNTDDGARLWVNGVQMVNDWTGHPVAENSGTVNLVAGQKYDIVFEYFEGGGEAVSQLSWSSPSRAKQVIPQNRLYALGAQPDGTGLRGEYFATVDLTGTPVLTRTDATVNFDWVLGSPGGTLPGNNFSARWKGQVQPQYSESYRFYTNTDDGVRLWVNGVQVVNDWNGHAATENQSALIALQAGQKYDIEMEYFESIGEAVAQLSWSSPSQPKQIIPQIRLYPAGVDIPPAPLNVLNFSFETPAMGSGNFQYSPTGGSWDFHYAGIAANGSGFTGSNPGAPLGSQVAFLQGTGAKFSQAIGGFVANTPYTLTFAAAQRNYGQAGQTWKVTLDGTTIGTFAPPQSATSYVDYSVQFSTSGGTFVLAFEGTNPNGGDNTVLIDNVRIVPTNTPPPEPPSPPLALAATAISSSQINLAWTDNSSNETGFSLERKTGAGGTWAVVATPAANATSFPNSGLAASTTYYYRIRASNSAGTSPYSNEAFATTLFVPPEPPEIPNLDRVDFDKVNLTDSFWAPRIQTNRTATIQKMFDELTNNHNLENFPKAAGLMGGNHDGWPWADGDVYGLVEAMAYSLKKTPDSLMQSRMDAIVNNIVAAQVSSGPLNGYINTYFQLGNAGRGSGGSTLTLQPWEDLQGAHEHIVIGGLVTAGIAHYNTTGQTNLIQAARRVSDHMHGLFGDAPKRSGIPGHQGLEAQLLKLFHVPNYGQQSDFTQAQFYIDERGRHSGGRPIYGEFCQDMHPLRSEVDAMGHCVRGAYNWEAATMLASITGETALNDSLVRIWDNIVDKKMYVTGGIGHRLCNEGFSSDYDLSNEWAYNETCAACGMLFWANRMANLRGDRKYADVLERILYNGLPSGRSLNGQRIYYNNLMTRTGTKSRTGISCCSINTIRTVPQIPGYQYASKQNDGIWAHLYMAGTAQIPYGGTTVTVQQTTNYPWEGSIQMGVSPQTPTAFTLHLRIPEWVENGTVSVNGQGVNVGDAVRGYLAISRTWQSGDTVQINFPMPVRRIYGHEKVWATQGRVAIARGPIVYCLESPYNPINVHRIVIPNTAAISVGGYNSGDLGGIVRLTGTGTNADGGNVNFTLIPYAVWDNANTSDNSSLAIWIPETIAAANNNAPDRGRLADATVTYSNGPGDPAAVNDGLMKEDSGDESIPRFTWWGRFGTEEWITYTFPQALTLKRSDIFWFSDAYRGGGCDFPSSFRIEYWNASNQWQQVQLDADYPSAGDYFATWHATTVRFTPVTTTKVRIVAQLRPGKSAGILEWRLPE